MAWQRQNTPNVLLGLVLLASGVLLLVFTAQTTFFQDTWAFLLDRQDFSADSFLIPHNEHIVVIPVAIEKLLLAGFGMRSAAPERVAMVLALLTTGWLVFVYMRRRVGPWPALLGVTMLLFLGAAWPVLLWPFEIALVGSAMAGVGMLLALEKGDRRGDVVACALLTVSVGFSSLGLCFIVAAAVDVFVRRAQRGIARSYVAAIPLFLYVIWYIGWGHTASNGVTLENVLKSPIYVLDGLASSVSGLLGLTAFETNNMAQPVWGRPILVVLVGLVIYRQIRRPGVSSSFWPLAAAAASYWLLAAFNASPAREAISSRYVHAGAIFVLLLMAELLRGIRFSRTALWIGAAVVLAAIAPGFVSLRLGADWLEEQAEFTKADLGALEIAARTVDPNFVLSPDVAGTGSLQVVNVGRYLEAVEKYGSPAYSPEELARTSELGRRQADIMLTHALPIFTEEAKRSASGPAGSCTPVPGGGSRSGIPLSPGVTRIEVAPGPSASIGLRRFSVGEYPVTSEAKGGSTTLLTIPHDFASRPWRLQVDAQQAVEVCS